LLNSGTLQKSVGSATSVIGLTNSITISNNGGTVNGQTGSINLNGAVSFSGSSTVNGNVTISGTGGSNSGTVTLGAGAVLDYTGGSHAFNAATTFGGAGTLSLSGATWTGIGTVSLDAGGMSWTGGALTVGGAGGVMVATGKTLALSGGASKVLDGGKLTNAGTVTWTGAGNLILNTGAQLTNNSLFDIQSDADFQYTGGAVPSLVNTGTLRKSGGSAVTVIGLSNPVAFSNSGTLDVQTGTLQYAGTNSFNTGTAFTGAGSSQVVSGAVFSGAISSTNLDLAGGSYSGTAVLSGTSKWSGGTISGANLSVPAGSTLNIANPSNVNLSVATLSNAGTVNWTGSGNLVMNDGAQLSNSGLFDIQTDASVQYTGGAVPTLLNSGTLQKSVGSATSVIGLTNSITISNNGGTVNGQTGSINLNGAVSFSGSSAVNGNVTVSGTGGSNSGTVILGAGAVLDYTGGSHAFNAATTFGGAGTLTLSGATWTGTGAVSLGAGGMNWTGGALAVGAAGGVTVATGKTLALSGGASKVLDGGKLTNAGTITWTGTGNLILNTGAQLTNNSLFDIQTDADFEYTSGAVASIVNTATLRKSSGSLITVIGLTNPFAFTNFGTIDVQVGTLNVQAGSFSHTGIMNLATGATFQRAGGFTNAGIIQGLGTVDVGAGNTLVNAGGTLRPAGVGAAGALAVTGNLNLAGGTIEIDLGGTAAGLSDKLAVSGNVTLGGALNASLTGGYLPVNADFIPIATMTGTASGNFASAILPANMDAGYNLAAGEASRLIFSTVGTKTFLNTASDLNWATPANWSGGALPGSGNTALISSGFAVLHPSGNDTVAALTVNAGNSLDVSGGSLTVNGATTVGGSLAVSGGTLVLNGTSSVATLGVTGGALNGSGNLTVGSTFNYSAGTIGLTGGMDINHTGSLVLPAMTALSSLLARATGDITLNGNVTTSGVGNSLVLAAGGNFLNAGNRVLSAGSNAGGDRWLVYSASPAGISKGGLSSNFRHYASTFGSYAPGSVSESGKGFIYASAAGALSVNPTATGVASHVYGDAPTASFGYTLTGFADAEDTAGNIGVAGAVGFGIPVPTSGNDAGSYTLNYASGLSSSAGYNFSAGTGLGYNITAPRLALRPATRTRSMATHSRLPAPNLPPLV
jgi:hypothetical protein